MICSPMRRSCCGERSACARSPRSGRFWARPGRPGTSAKTRKIQAYRFTPRMIPAVTRGSPRVSSNRRGSGGIIRPMALTHFDAGGAAHMVDVGAKDATHRVARAAGRILMRPETLALVRAGTAAKGDVLGVARIAAIQAAKRTADLIPLAHPIPITRVAAEFADAD